MTIKEWRKSTEKWDVLIWLLFVGEFVWDLCVLVALMALTLAFFTGCVTTAPPRVATERAAAYAMRDCREAAKHLPPAYADRLCSERVAEVCAQGRLGADCWAEQWVLVRK